MVSFVAMFLRVILILVVFLSVTTSFVVLSFQHQLKIQTPFIVQLSSSKVTAITTRLSRIGSMNQPLTTKPTTTTLTQLTALYNPGQSASRNSRNGGGRQDDRSKRQFRVGELVKTELARILHSGIIKGDASYLDNELRQRISIVGVDISPDLRQARVSVSIRGSNINNNNNNHNSNSDDDEENEDSKQGTLMKESTTKYYETDPLVDKRRAYSWLVGNTKFIRHTLAQKMSHMKTSPTLTFAQVDVAAATDVMYLIDKVSKGYTRENIDEWDYYDDDEDDDDDDDWDEIDNEFFDNK